MLPSNYINMNFIAPFKIEGDILHIAIPDSSKLSLMRNLKTIAVALVTLVSFTVNAQQTKKIDRIQRGGDGT